MVKKMQYRPEIDGLRAIAVLAVIFYHAGIGGLDGGFAGVDIFFVISGFLITNIIYEGLRNKSFSSLHFYERRARRLFPALFVMIIMVSPMMFFVLVPYQLKDYAQSVLASLFYLSNVLFHFEGGYFAVEASQKPLLHTWSLAIEEQYYLVFPWALMLISPLPYMKTIGILGFVSLVSYLAMMLQGNSEGSASFYLIQYRAWELLAGSMTAVWMLNRHQIGKPIYAALGLGLVATSLFVTSDSQTWPNSLTLVPVTGVVLILLFSSKKNFIGEILSRAGLRQIGLMSYSLYLWHFPLLAALNVWFLGDPGWPWVFAALVLTALLGYLSWRYVEIPFRNAETVPKAAFIAFSLITIIVLSLFSYTGLKTQGFFDVKVDLVSESWRGKIIDRDKEIAKREELLKALSQQASEPYFDKSSKNILILGDSLSEDIFMAVSANESLFPRSEFRRFRLDDICMSYLAQNTIESFRKQRSLDSCQLEVDALIDSGVLSNADQIVLAAGWQSDTYMNGIILANYLSKRGLNVSVVGLAAFNDMTSLSMMLSRIDIPIENFLYSNLREKFLSIDRELRVAVSEAEGVIFLDKLSLFCNIEKEECQMLDRDGNLPIFDASHLTLTGLHFYAEKMHQDEWFEETE